MVKTDRISGQARRQGGEPGGEGVSGGSYLYDLNANEWWTPLSSDVEQKLDADSVNNRAAYVSGSKQAESASQDIIPRQIVVQEAVAGIALAGQAEQPKVKSIPEPEPIATSGPAVQIVKSKVDTINRGEDRPLATNLVTPESDETAQPAISPTVELVDAASFEVSTATVEPDDIEAPDKKLEVQNAISRAKLTLDKETARSIEPLNQELAEQEWWRLERYKVVSKVFRTFYNRLSFDNMDDFSGDTGRKAWAETIKYMYTDKIKMCYDNPGWSIDAIEAKRNLFGYVDYDHHVEDKQGRETDEFVVVPGVANIRYDQACYVGELDYMVKSINLDESKLDEILEDTPDYLADRFDALRRNVKEHKIDPNIAGMLVIGELGRELGKGECLIGMMELQREKLEEDREELGVIGRVIKYNPFTTQGRINRIKREQYRYNMRKLYKPTTIAYRQYRKDVNQVFKKIFKTGKNVGGGLGAARWCSSYHFFSKFDRVRGVPTMDILHDWAMVQNEKIRLKNMTDEERYDHTRQQVGQIIEKGARGAGANRLNTATNLSYILPPVAGEFDSIYDYAHRSDKKMAKILDKIKDKKRDIYLKYHRY